jgi:hypothetical protein
LEVDIMETLRNAERSSSPENRLGDDVNAMYEIN